jgi:hypothetical protein
MQIGAYIRSIEINPIVELLPDLAAKIEER